MAKIEKGHGSGINVYLMPSYGLLNEFDKSVVDKQLSLNRKDIPFYLLCYSLFAFRVSVFASPLQTNKRN